MATYNRGHLIEESLRSVKKQVLKNWECLIIDDGSKDNTEQKVTNTVAGDQRFLYLERPENYKKGLSGCRNYGLDLAKGEYILFWDDDDIGHPENLRYCIEKIRGSQYSFIRYDKQPFFGSYPLRPFKPIENSRIITFSPNDLEKMITGEIPFASCNVLWDVKCFENKRFNEDLVYAEEWELYSRILMEGHSGLSSSAILYFNRKHPNSNTGEFQKENPVRLRSLIAATELILKNLAENNLYSEGLKKFFLQKGFRLKSTKIIQKSLEFSQAGRVERVKYKLGFWLYPFLKPIFNLKSKN